MKALILQKFHRQDKKPIAFSMYSMNRGRPATLNCYQSLPMNVTRNVVSCSKTGHVTVEQCPYHDLHQNNNPWCTRYFPLCLLSGSHCWNYSYLCFWNPTAKRMLFSFKELHMYPFHCRNMCASCTQAQLRGGRMYIQTTYLEALKV